MIERQQGEPDEEKREHEKIKRTGEEGSMVTREEMKGGKNKVTCVERVNEKT